MKTYRIFTDDRTRGYAQGFNAEDAIQAFIANGNEQHINYFSHPMMRSKLAADECKSSPMPKA